MHMSGREIAWDGAAQPMFKSPSNRWILVAAFIAMVVKLILAIRTIGTNDTLAFYFFSNDLRSKGLLDVYEKNVIFNHTPLVASYITAISEFAEHSWQKKEAFPFLLRLPGIIADFLSAFILVRLRHTTGNPPPWAAMAFILSPLALMISGFHGNVDSVLALGMLAALWLAVENRPALCGLALGLACNIN